MGRRRVPLETRFWQKIAKSGPNECWIWNGALVLGGYGTIRMAAPSRKMVNTHRAAYELTHGSIPDGMVVMHSCDNRRCCNPAHLSLGTQLDNMADMHAKGRAAKGMSHGMRKLTADDVREIRRRLPNETHVALAREFGVTHPTITKINLGQRWADVH